MKAALLFLLTLPLSAQTYWNDLYRTPIKGHNLVELYKKNVFGFYNVLESGVKMQLDWNAPYAWFRRAEVVYDPELSLPGGYSISRQVTFHTGIRVPNTYSIQQPIKISTFYWGSNPLPSSERLAVANAPTSIGYSTGNLIEYTTGEHGERKQVSDISPVVIKVESPDNIPQPFWVIATVECQGTHAVLWYGVDYVDRRFTLTAPGGQCLWHVVTIGGAR